MKLMFEAAAIISVAGLTFGPTAEGAKSLNSGLDSSVRGQGTVLRSEQQSATRSATGSLTCTQHLAVHLTLAGARPAVSKEIAITSVIIFPNDCRNKEITLLGFDYLVF
jgi:hypothetical protein